MKQSVACEHYPVIAVLHVPADAVLGMAGGVESLDGDVSDIEAFAMSWGLCDSFGVLSRNDR